MRFLREPIVLGGIVEAASDPPQVAGSNQSVESLIDRSARSKISEVIRGPDAGVPGAEMRSRMATGILDAELDISQCVRYMRQLPDLLLYILMSELCNNILTLLFIQALSALIGSMAPRRRLFLYF
jgi:hypothetical protein